MTDPTDPTPASDPTPPQPAGATPPPGATPPDLTPPSSATAYPSAPQANPYGGAQPPGTGSLAYVEQHFGPVASFWQRVAALLIDTLLCFVGAIPALVGAVLLALSFPETDEYGYVIDGTADTGLALTGGLLIGLGVLASLAIQVWNRIFRMGRTGQSVGKKALGLMLIHEQTGRPIGATQAFVRELVSGLVNQIVYLSYLWMLWDDNKQTLADKVVHSTVVQVPKR